MVAIRISRSISGSNPFPFVGPFTFLRSPVYRSRPASRPMRRRAICFVLEQNNSGVPVVDSSAVIVTNVSTESGDRQISAAQLTGNNSERLTYLLVALISMAVMTVYYRFYWAMQGEEEVPVVEILSTIPLSLAAAVGMEIWARWVHQALWHASLWNMHQSHHKPREGPLELNDVFSIINAGPAITLLYYGFFNKGLFPNLCFWAGVEITILGMVYIFVHDGVVHKRFPVGPIADVPYLQKLAAAHQLHHSDKFNGVPYGFFLGPKEVGEVAGGLEELEREIKRMKKAEDDAT